MSDILFVGATVAVEVTNGVLNWVLGRNMLNERLAMAWKKVYKGTRRWFWRTAVVLTVIGTWSKIAAPVTRSLGPQFAHFYLAHQTPIDLVLGAALAAGFGLAAQGALSSRSGRANARQHAGVLYYDLLTAKKSLDSMKHYIEWARAETDVSALVLRTPFHFDEKWRDHAVALLDRITEEHYAKIAQLYYYLEKCRQGHQTANLKMVQEALAPFLGQYQHVDPLMLELSVDDVLGDLKRLADGRRIKRRAVPAFIDELKYYRFRQSHFQSAENRLESYLGKHGPTDGDVLRDAMYREMLKELPARYRSDPLFNRFIFDVGQMSKKVGPTWDMWDIKDTGNNEPHE